MMSGRIAHASLCVLLASGCVPTRSELRAPVDRELAQRLGMPVETTFTSSIAALLDKPIDRAAAVKVALANSARLRAALEQLGIAGGELGAAIGLGPVRIEAAYRFETGGHGNEFEVDAIQSVMGLITAPRRHAAARADLAGARAMATATAIRLVAQVEIAFNDLIAAQQEIELRRTAFDAADAAATIRERMHAAGNTSDLAQARDRDAREQARLDLARAEAAVEVRREALNALLGLSGNLTKWTAPGVLADPPAAPPALDDLEAASVAASLELASGRARVEAAENRLGVENVRWFLPDLGFGVSVADEGEGLGVGPAVAIGIPLFDQRTGDRAKARAATTKAQHELLATAVELRADARAARVSALAAYQETRHLREVILPLRQQIVDQTLLHYNAMDADPFELIVARRQLAEAGKQYLDALRRYWNAMATVTALRRGTRVSASSTASTDEGTPISSTPISDGH